MTETTEKRGYTGTPGNAFRLVHGRHSKRHGLVLARLGRRYRHLEGYVRALRRDAEAYVADTHGEVSFEHNSLINLACRFEVTALAATWAASKEEDPEKVQTYLKTASWASAERHRCIAGLRSKPTDNGQETGDWGLVGALRGGGE